MIPSESASTVARRYLFVLLLLLAWPVTAPPALADDEEVLARQTELRQAVFRLIARQTSAISLPMELFLISTRDPTKRLLANRVYDRVVENSLNIAVGPHPDVNLLDAVVLFTLAHHVNERHWQRELYGDLGQEIVAAFADARADAWKVAARYLTPEQSAALDKLIRDWIARNPDELAVETVRFDEFSSVFTDAPLASRGGGGFFLPEVGRATAAVDEVRLLSERLLIIIQTMPWVMQLNLRDVMYQMALEPEVQGLLRNMDSMSSAFVDFPDKLAAERQAFVAGLQAERQQAIEQLGDRISIEQQSLIAGLGSERQQAIDQLVDGLARERQALVSTLGAEWRRSVDYTGDRWGAERHALLSDLDSKSPTLTALMAETRQTLTVGSEVAARLERTTELVDNIMARQAEMQDPATPSRPLDLEEVRTTLQEISTAASQLNVLIASIVELEADAAESERPSAFARALTRFDAEATELVYIIAGLVIATIVLTVICVVAGMIVYRSWHLRAERQLAAAGPAAPNPPEGSA